MSVLAGSATVLRANALANITSQAFVAFVTVATAPFFLARMGPEAYGLIGVFALMNAWFQVLDGGLSLTLARQCARYRAGSMEGADLRAQFRTLELFFALTALIGAAAIASSAHGIAGSWLKTSRLPSGEVAGALLIMGLTIPLQWMSGLYRGLYTGFERQVWLAGFNAAVNGARFLGAGLALAFLAPTPAIFFRYQLAIAVIELGVLMVRGRALLPRARGAERLLVSSADLGPLLKFAAGLGFATLVWSLITQTDRLVLSRVLPLGDYGVFTLAVLAASGVLIVSAPIGQALMPRLAALAIGGDASLIDTYRRASQWVALITLPLALVLAAFATPVLFVWTGEARTAGAAAPILTPYALGNALVGVGAFAYYLQYAKGDLRLHVAGNVGLAIVLAPAMAFAAWRYGAVGAGWTWCVVNLLYFMFWVPRVHARLAPGLHGAWLAGDVGPIAATAGATAGILRMAVVFPPDRAGAAIVLAGCALAIGGAATLASSAARASLAGLISHLDPKRRGAMAA